jgi:hypothetical protein
VVGCVSVCAYFAVLFIPRKEETRLPPARVASWVFVSFRVEYGVVLAPGWVFFFFFLVRGFWSEWMRGIDAAWILGDLGAAWMHSMVRRARVFPRLMPI